MGENPSNGRPQPGAGPPASSAVSDSGIFNAYNPGDASPAAAAGPQPPPREPSAAPSPMPLVGTTVSHYRIVERLGGGGMGVVFKAWDQRLDRHAALKFLSPHRSGSDDFKRRFAREARTASRLEHPNICTVFETDQAEDGRLFIAMAFCEGESLKRKIDRGPLPFAQALAVGAQVAAGLAAAHDKGVVHRDIKPGNIIVAEDGRVKIVDFGIARLADQTRLTRTGDVMGTTAYVAPELFLSETSDHRVDLWALGVVLYEMVTGRLPWGTADEREMVNAIVKRTPRPLGSLRPGVPPELERLVARALAKRPAERYQRAEEMSADLLSVAELLGAPPADGADADDLTVVEAPLSAGWASLPPAPTGAPGSARDTPVRAPATAPAAPSSLAAAPPPPAAPPSTPLAAPTGAAAPSPSSAPPVPPPAAAEPGSAAAAGSAPASRAAEPPSDRREGSRAAGRIVSHYRILGQIGGGGMGVVYKAQDLLLGRVVALKFLPPELTRDNDAKTRFLQEARAASALDHPNICTIHEVGETEEGHLFLAMACYDGETLKQRLQRGRMAIDEAIELGQQVARGLVKAHRNGIVHRDIKPANLMVTNDEIVKILDFGIAKLAGEVGLTRTGSSLGTPAYMSPEQARGEEVDARTDVWSLGAVMYEMVTGRRPFRGEHEQTVLYALFNEEPEPILQLRPDAPPEVVRIVSRMLAKDRNLRYPTAAEALAELRALYGPASGTLTGVARPLPAAAMEPPPAARRRRRRQLYYPLAAVALALAAAAAVWLWRGRAAPPAAAAQRVHDERLTELEGKETSPSIDPNGNLFLYVKKIDNRNAIFMQHVRSPNAIPLTASSTSDDTQPAYSPDGQQIAFRSERDGGGLFIMGAMGESVRRLTDSGFNPTWSPAGDEIAYATEGVDGPLRRYTTSHLWRTKVVSGERHEIFAGDAVQPSWSPHGQRIAYWSADQRSTRRAIWTIPAAGGTPVAVTDDAHINWNPVWSADGRYLYFASDRGGPQNLWKVPIDEASGRVLGSAEPLTTQTLGALPSFSHDGSRMVYAADDSTFNLQVFNFDAPAGTLAGGEPKWTMQSRRDVATINSSADGQWIAYSTVTPQEDLFVVHPDGSGLRRLTDDAYKNRAPSFSADGSRIVFGSNRGGRHQAWAINTDGSKLTQLTAFPDHQVFEPELSPDGRRLVCNLDFGGAAFVDLTAPLAARRPQPLPDVPGAGAGYFGVTSWSPDGLRLAGRDRLHRLVIYDPARRTFTPLAQTGVAPRWLSDGKRLIYVDLDQNGVSIVDTATGVSHQVRKGRPGVSFRIAGTTASDRFLYLIDLSEEGDIWMRTVD